MAASRPLPKLSEEELIELAGGVTVKSAKELVLKGSVRKAASVSYTHLTLPTILLV